MRRVGCARAVVGTRRARSASCLAVIALLGLIAGGGLARAANPTQDAAPSTRTWHATTVVSSRVGHRIIHYWSKGSSLRAETLIAGHPIVTIVRGDRYLAIDRLTGEGLDIARSPRARAEDGKRERPFGNELEEVRAAGGEKVDELRQSGVSTEVWRVTDAKTRRTVWVSTREPRVPVRYEIYVRGGGDTITTDYANWGFDLEIPDRFFATPEDLALERLDYETYLSRSQEGPVGAVPVLYPDLLHGGPLP